MKHKTLRCTAETAALLLDSLYQGDPLAAIREMIRTASARSGQGAFHP